MPNHNQVPIAENDPNKLAIEQNVQPHQAETVSDDQLTAPNHENKNTEEVFAITHGDKVIYGSAADAQQKCEALKGMPLDSIAGLMKVAAMAEKMKVEPSKKSQPTKPKEATVKSESIAKKPIEAVKTQLAEEQIHQATLNVSEKETTIIPTAVIERPVQIKMPAAIVHKIMNRTLEAPQLTVEQKESEALPLLTSTEITDTPTNEVAELITHVRESTSAQVDYEIDATALELQPDLTETIRIEDSVVEVSVVQEENNLESVEELEVSGSEALIDLAPLSEMEDVTYLETTDDVTPVQVAEVEPLATAEVVEARRPATVTAEFMLQVLPSATEQVYDYVSELEPEAAAEVAAQVEMITVVADRLHELVVQGKTENEEAKQIEAFLKREYEQLLVAVGIEPTPELIAQFIQFIYSENYQLGNETMYIEADEGTHEKKLFDEQSVFAKAQLASRELGRKLGTKLGKLAVYKSAA